MTLVATQTRWEGVLRRKSGFTPDYDNLLIYFTNVYEVDSR
ncbi:MAG: hypothetical protein SAL07_04365 [Oscillatoria sp. PMC 1051.18]|nr:hypothetical protein [Oscillatoria sp. PMC 1051.18]